MPADRVTERKSPHCLRELENVSSRRCWLGGEEWVGWVRLGYQDYSGHTWTENSG